MCVWKVISGRRSQEEGREQLIRKFHELLQEVREIHLTEKPGLSVTCSIGAVCSSRKTCFDDGYQRADDALYAAKKQGKNRFFIS